MLEKFWIKIQKQWNIKKLIRLKISHQIDYVKKLIDTNIFDVDSNFSKHSHYYRTIVRRIQRKYKKLRVLIKRRCIQIKINIKNKKMKTLLNNENEINFINRIMIKQLKIFFFFIHEKTCDIVNIKLKIFDVHFLIVVVIDNHEHSRYFEKSFLKININENIILDMSWLKLTYSKINWKQHIIIGRKNTTFLITARRIEIIEKENMTKNFLINNFVVYVLHIRHHDENTKNLEDVHMFKRVQINVVMQNTKIKTKKKIEISKKWRHIKKSFKNDLTYELS